MGKASYGLFLGGLPRGPWRPSEGPRRRHWNILAFYGEVRQLGYLAFGSHFSWAEGGSFSLGAFNTQPAPPPRPQLPSLAPGCPLGQRVPSGGETQEAKGPVETVCRGPPGRSWGDGPHAFSPSSPSPAPSAHAPWGGGLFIYP